MGNFITMMLVSFIIFYPAIYYFSLIMFRAKKEQKMKREILKLIIDEIRIAQTENQRTSRLTSLYMRISEKY